LPREHGRSARIFGNFYRQGAKGRGEEELLVMS
jgi:hypothetical protein